MARYLPKHVREQQAIAPPLGNAVHCCKPTRREIEEALESPAVSFWLKDALGGALERDCVDAWKDAEYLAHLLKLVADDLLGR